jgi:hypothetical protein
MKNRVVCVVPTIRLDSIKKFKETWKPFFDHYQIPLIVVYDGERLRVEVNYPKPPEGSDRPPQEDISDYTVKSVDDTNKDLFFRFTDSCRNLGFVAAAELFNFDYLLTLDDDVSPCNDREGRDTIHAHLNAFEQPIITDWCPTFTYKANSTIFLPRGVPYKNRIAYPDLSHGIWIGVLDWDGETQLFLESRNLPLGKASFYQGCIPRGALFPLCGMNVMIRRRILPYFYYAPMGPDTQLPLNRFGDIWMGIFLKKKMDSLGLYCVSGMSAVVHERASNSQKNFELEQLGREWNEMDFFVHWKDCPVGRNTKARKYFKMYESLRSRYANLIYSIPIPEDRQWHNIEFPRYLRDLQEMTQKPSTQ